MGGGQDLRTDLSYSCRNALCDVQPERLCGVVLLWIYCLTAQQQQPEVFGLTQSKLVL